MKDQEPKNSESCIDCSFLDEYSSSELKELKAEIDKRLSEEIENKSEVDISDIGDSESDQNAY